MANELLQGLLSNLLTPVDPREAQRAEGARLVSMMGTPGAAATYYAPQRAADFTKGLGQLFGMDQRTSADKLRDQLTKQAPDLSTAAGLRQLAQLAEQSGDKNTAAQLSLQATMMGTQEAQAAKVTTDAATKVTNARSGFVNLINASGLSLQDRANLTSAVKQGSFDGKTDELLKLLPIGKTEGTKRTPTQIDNLYSNFTPASISARLADPTAPLVPIPAAVAPKMSDAAQRFVDEGLVAGSVAFQEKMAAYNASLVKANSAGNEPTSVEVIGTLNDDLNKSPNYTETARVISAVQLLKNTLPLLGTSNPQAYTVISAALPMLYQSNARASSEIDNFRDRKGITATIGDWATKALGGTATPETIGNMKELINILDATFQQDLVTSVTRTAEGYKGVFPDDLLRTWTNNLLRPNESIDDIIAKYAGQGQ
jgi:hypothetical protein